MILDKPYAERRIVVIIDEASVTAAVLKQFARNRVRVLSPWSILMDAFMLSSPVDYTPARQPPAGTLVASLQSVSSELELPPGHPIAGHAYAGHPLAPKRYLPLAAFHGFLFEEKVNELMTVLASLGATRVKVTCTHGYRTTAGGSFGVSKGADLSGGAKGTAEKTEQASFEEHYRPKGEPKLPANLVWYGSEASWQAVAQRRLDFGTSQFKTRLSYEDSFGVDANLKVGLDKLGVKLGGNFSEFESTLWEFEGEFA